MIGLQELQVLGREFVKVNNTLPFAGLQPASGMVGQMKQPIPQLWKRLQVELLDAEVAVSPDLVLAEMVGHSKFDCAADRVGRVMCGQSPSSVSSTTTTTTEQPNTQKRTTNPQLPADQSNNRPATNSQQPTANNQQPQHSTCGSLTRVL